MAKTQDVTGEAVAGFRELITQYFAFRALYAAVCVEILAVCPAAMGKNARLLICERIIPPGNAPSSTKIINLHMLMTSDGGKERTDKEFRALRTGAGFQLALMVATSTP